MSLELVLEQLTEMGHGPQAVPAIADAARALLARSGVEEGSFELADLLHTLRETGQAHVAGWIETAIAALAPGAVPRREHAPAAPTRAAAPTLVLKTSVTPETPQRPYGAHASAGYRDLADLRFQIAHAFEGVQHVRREHYAPLAGLVCRGERVVDIGCGDGTFLELVRARGADGVGIDLDPATVAACRAKGLDVHCGRAQEMAWDWGPVDFVSMLHIIEHIQPAEALEILERACRALSPDGRLFVVTPNFANPFVAHTNFWLDITHVRPYPEPLLNSFVAALGFPYFQSGVMGNGMDTWCYAFRNPAHQLGGGSP